MKFDLHTHSTHSVDAVMTAQELVDALVKAGIDGFALTDHNTVAGIRKARAAAKKAGLEFIPGIEVSALRGHILGLGIEENIPRGLPAEEVVDRIHGAGGLAIAAHPYDILRQRLGDLVKELPFDAVETANGKTIYGNARARRVAEELNAAQTGGSDAHAAYEVGSAWTECDDPIRDIKNKKTKACGGFSMQSIKSRLERRLKGVPLFPKV
ncbi:MAG: PHP domain-containing protein [Candidatus Diapherotrites archaeon]|nr:PHP domain-containing protein [Candidatus Diapherotrites archaeon]